jgi:hypothetical protein
MLALRRQDMDLDDRVLLVRRALSAVQETLAVNSSQRRSDSDIGAVCVAAGPGSVRLHGLRRSRRPSAWAAMRM